MTTDHFSQTVPRALVHKRSVAEVLLTSVVGREDSLAPERGWVAHAQLPRLHGHYSDTVGEQARYHDPYLLLEALRQGGIAGSHVFHGVPEQAGFFVRSYELALTRVDAFEVKREPLDLELRYHVERAFRKSPGAPKHGLDVSAEVFRGPDRCARFRSSFSWLGRDRWEFLRKGATTRPPAPPSRVPPATVNRLNPINVMIGEPAFSARGGNGEAVIVVDTGHATIFDHPLDHLPGGLIVEAFRQTAFSVFGQGRDRVFGPVRIRCGFHSFAELHTACTVRLAQDEATKLRFSGDVLQHGQTRARAELLFSSYGFSSYGEAFAGAGPARA